MTEANLQNSNTDEEISSIDTILFFRKNWRFLGLVTLLLSFCITSVVWSKPKNFAQKLTIAIELNSTIWTVPNLDLEKANNLGVEFLTNLQNDNVNLQATYNTQNQNIEIILKSPQSNDLTNKSEEIITKLQGSFREKIKSDLENSLQSLNRNIKKNELILKDLETQINQASNNIPRLEALELERTGYIVGLTSLKVDQQFLDDSKVNLAEFTEQVLPVKIIKKTPIEQQPTSLLQISILAVIASFMVAILVVLIKEQLYYLGAVKKSQKNMEIEGK